MRAFALFMSAASAAAAAPGFPSSWSSYCAQDMVQNQGSYALPNGDLCCSEEANQCQIQVQSQESKLFWSFATNQTSNVFGPNYQSYAIVDDFNLGMEMSVDSTFTCQSYCPIQGPMQPFNVQGYTDAGAANILGQTTELWQQVTTLLNVTMETDNLYINQANLSSAYPVIDIDVLTPFGEYIGESNTTYTKFTAGPQDPKWFAVKGASTCPQDSGCDSSAQRQLHRLTVRRRTDYVMAHFRAQAAKAASVLEAANGLIAAMAARK